MDYENIISFVPMQNESEISRSLNSLFSLASQSLSKYEYAIDSFKFDKTLDPNSINVSKFTENFKQVKTKLAEIEKAIQDLEKREKQIKTTYEDTYKKLHDFFNIPKESEVFDVLQEKAYKMLEALNLDSFYAERDNLMNQYSIAVPLLTQVKEEFFKDQTKISNCPICYENDVCYAVYPCGHLTCAECKKKLVTSCFQCRGNIVKIMKIYTS